MKQLFAARPRKARPDFHYICSVVKEVSRLAAEVQAGREDGQAQHLSSLLDALTSHVSLLNEREHDALLTQVLGVSCWVGPQVFLK